MSDFHDLRFPPAGALEALLAAGRSGSLSSAAVALGVTHGAVSRRVQALERWLGAAVFERHGRGVRYTPVGAQFARRVERSMGDILGLAADIRSSRSVGIVRVSVLPSMARLWLMPRMTALQGRPVDLNVVVATEHRVAHIDGRDADAAIRFGYGDWTGLECSRLFGEELIAVAAPAIAAQVGGEPAALLRHTILHDSDTVSWRKWFRLAGTAFRPSAGEQRFDDYDLALAAAAAGVGIALARLPLAESAIKASGLVRCADVVLPTARAHWVVTRTGERRAAVLLFAERLKTLIVAEAVGEKT